MRISFQNCGNRSTRLWVLASFYRRIVATNCGLTLLQLHSFSCNNNLVDKYKESEETRELKSEIAESRPRDNEGHFISQEKQEEHEKKGPIERLFSENVHYSKSQDDILDVHVGNPLRRITQLLEDIRRQKAFSFTLKGSLGVMGVFLALSVFGILGGGKILCDKGVQKQIGVIKVLNVQEKEPANLPLLSNILEYFSPRPTHNSIVLVRSDETIITIPHNKNIKVDQYANYPVVATGNYDSCGQTLRINDPNAVEIYVKTIR